MPEELISASTMAIGVAGYLGKEVFKPTLERIGESMRDFLTGRVIKIFAAAEKMVDPAAMGAPLEPGFLALFIQRASFAEDREDLTIRWAHLLADAARAYSNKHVNYVEILSQLGPVEVHLLDSLVGERSLDPRRPSNFHATIRHELVNLIAKGSGGREAAVVAVGAILAAELVSAAAVRSVEIPYVEDGTPNSAVGGVDKEGWDPIAFDILIRQRLLEEVSLDLENSLPAAKVRLYVATGLGLDFVRACRGIPEDSSAG